MWPQLWALAPVQVLQDQCQVFPHLLSEMVCSHLCRQPVEQTVQPESVTRKVPQPVAVEVLSVHLKALLQIGEDPVLGPRSPGLRGQLAPVLFFQPWLGFHLEVTHHVIKIPGSRITIAAPCGISAPHCFGIYYKFSVRKHRWDVI